jgi:acyl-CoA thioester hydrolase
MTATRAMSPSGAGTGGDHRLAVRVYYEDTDAGGIVYHAAFLRFAERARTELLRELGLDHRRLRDEHGVIFAVRRCTVDFLAPGRLDDLLEVRTRVARRGGASLDLVQEVMAAERVLARLAVRLALLDRRHRAARVPAAVAAAFAALRPSVAESRDEPGRDHP